MEKFQIRKCQPDDGLEFLKLKNLVWESAYKNILPSEVFEIKKQNLEEDAIKFKDFLKNKEVLYIFASINEKVVGLACGALKSYKENFKNYGELVAIYVHPDFQNQGVGRALKDYFEKWLKENKIKTYIVGVLEENIPARKIYEKWGGEKTDVVSDLKFPNKTAKEVFYEFDLEKTKTLKENFEKI